MLELLCLESLLSGIALSGIPFLSGKKFHGIAYSGITLSGKLISGISFAGKSLFQYLWMSLNCNREGRLLLSLSAGHNVLSPAFKVCM